SSVEQQKISSFQDPPQPLDSRLAANEFEGDKAQAVTLFAAARALQLREENAKALRLYQRAFRYDPQSVDIAREIVTLAIKLNREGTAIRYALKAAQLDKELDPILLRSLGLRLEEQGDWQNALKLYQRAIAMGDRQKSTSSGKVLLQLECGRLLSMMEKPREAASCFAVVNDALDHPEKNGLDEDVKKTLLEDPLSLYTMFGDCFLEAGRPEEARAAFEHIRQLEPNEQQWQLNLALVLQKKGKPAEAFQALQAAFDKHLSVPGIRPYELLEEILADLDKKAELIPRLEKLQQANPKNTPLKYFLAKKYLQSDLLQKAEVLYRSLLEEAPTLTGYRSLAEIYRKRKNSDKLLAILGETVEKTGVLDTLGSEEVLLSKDDRLMQDLIDSARKQEIKAGKDKTSFGKCFAVGLLALNNKQWSLAGEFFQAAVDGNAKQAAEVYLVWGIGLLMDNRPAEASKVFQQAIDRKALPENNPIFYFYLAGALAMEDRIDEALVAAEKAARLKKDSVRFRTRVAWVYYHAKRYREATTEYRKLIDEFGDDYRDNENREALKEVRLALSNLAVLQKNISEAQEWLEEVLDEFPDDPGAMNDLGFLWADENLHLPRARKLIEKAVEIEPENSSYRDSLGWVLFRIGRPREAIVQLEKAVKNKPDPIIYEHLGDVYEKLGEMEKASAAWLRAAEFFRREKEELKAVEMEKKSQKKR
ncbi:MAG: tetratricopeptide repeat protein, partial [Thermoguttaceae bacterium]